MTSGFSLQRRLAVSMLLIFLSGLGASAVFFYIEVLESKSDLRARTLHGQARDLIRGLSATESGGFDLTLPPDWAEVYGRSGSGFTYTLYDPAGAPVANSANLTKPLPIVGGPDEMDLDTVQFTGVGPELRAFLATEAPGGYRLVVGRAQPDPEMLAEGFLLEESYEQFLVFVPFLLGSLLLIWLISGWSLRSLIQASREAEAAGPADPDARIGTGRLPSEVRPLVDAVNGALDRLAQAYLAERRLTADAAHELRTPLAVLSLRLQRARAGTADWAGIEKDLANLTRIVGQLMDLARKESAARADGAKEVEVNLGRVVREAAAQVLPLVQAAGRTLDVEATEVTSHGHADDLRDMVVNLLDNALVHGQGGIRVRLWTEPGAESRRAILEVSDQGPGVPAELRDAAFDRFRRGGTSSTGAGLGLAIVRQVARNHGGDAGFSPDGGWVRVTLPLRGDKST